MVPKCWIWSCLSYLLRTPRKYRPFSSSEKCTSSGENGPRHPMTIVLRAVASAFLVFGSQDFYYWGAAGAGLPTASASALKIRVAGSAQGMLFVLSVMVGLPSGQSPEEMSLLTSTATTASRSGL